MVIKVSANAQSLYLFFLKRATVAVIRPLYTVSQRMLYFPCFVSVSQKILNVARIAELTKSCALIFVLLLVL